MVKHIGFGFLAALITIAGSPAAGFSQTQPTAIPAPEAQFVPKAQVSLTENRVTVKLINTTNAPISYQAIGDTNVRTLPGRGTVTLQGLRVPSTLTFHRQDAGLLNITPKQSTQSANTIDVTLDATTNLGIDSPTMRIESNGSVFLY